MRASKIPFHPRIFAIYLVILLYALNVEQIKATVNTRPLVILPVVAVLNLAFLKLLIKNWHRAAILTTIYLGLFFAYGHLYQNLKVNPLLGLSLVRHRFLIIVFFVIASLCTWPVGYKLRNL